ncbi:MAG: carbonic anhydrase family protein [Candidatus Accumulibacter sp.]|jgi:carbonic anhydrase|nr:carbonic anhydrase family protein [Accumulibacter sp.]
MFPVPFSVKADAGQLSMKPLGGCSRFSKKGVFRAVFLFCLGFSMTAHAAWQLVLTEQGKRIDIDRESIVPESGEKYQVKSRVVLDKPIVDPRTAAAYQSIEITHSFNCAERIRATLSRRYYKENGELLNQEEIKSPFYMVVKSGTADDRLLRAVCRAKDAVAFEGIGPEILERLRKHNTALIAQETKKRRGTSSRTDIRIESTARGAKTLVSKKPKSAALKNALVTPENSPSARPPWSYSGDKTGPALWGRLRPEYALCSSGKRQSPIDIRDTVALDLEPFRADYSPAMMRVIDSDKGLALTVYGGGMAFQGKKYELKRIDFHRPAETRMHGKTFDMEAQLVHHNGEGKLAIVSVLFERGQENPVVQLGLNNLPLERGGEFFPPDQRIEVEHLLPEDRRYFAFMGSLSSPPCTEGVVWIVFRQPRQVSSAQIEIFERLYAPNARPVQPAYDRLIKESR